MDESKTPAAVRAFSLGKLSALQWMMDGVVTREKAVNLPFRMEELQLASR
jgi:hypothetical protein